MGIRERTAHRMELESIAEEAEIAVFWKQVSHILI